MVVVHPETLPASIVLPTVALFHKIHSPGRNLAYLYTLKKTNKYVKEGKFPERLEELRSTIDTMVSKIQGLEGPLFQHEPNTTGIVMTCKMGPLCLANLHHLLDNMNTSLPVGLSSLVSFL